MVNNIIPTNTLPVASQHSRAFREVMEERRDITFPTAARLTWDAGPAPSPWWRKVDSPPISGGGLIRCQSHEV